jgi:alpha-tubulin suppressor-like RCC1 family protein
MVTLGKQHVKDGWLRFMPSKGRKQTKQVVLSEKPWFPVLANIVAISACGDLTFLVTEYGKPFTAAGFGNWFTGPLQRSGAATMQRPRAAQDGCDAGG